MTEKLRETPEYPGTPEDPEARGVHGEIMSIMGPDRSRMPIVIYGGGLMFDPSTGTLHEVADLHTPLSDREWRFNKEQIKKAVTKAVQEVRLHKAT